MNAHARTTLPSLPWVFVALLLGQTSGTALHGEQREVALQRYKAALGGYVWILPESPSALPIRTRQMIVKANLPYWQMAPGEDFYGLPFNYYKEHCVKRVYLHSSDRTVNLLAWDDFRHHKFDGSYNALQPWQNLIGQFSGPPGSFQHHKFTIYNGDEVVTRVQLIDPRVTPTYAFFQMVSSTRIWIRYFMFFGFNPVGVNAAPVEFASHFADWIHISVQLDWMTPQGVAPAQVHYWDPKNWKPTRYYYSAHAGGSAYEPYPGGGGLMYASVRDVSGQQLALSSQGGAWTGYHPVVFVAEGTHETYGSIGQQANVFDKTGWGNLAVAPFIPPDTYPSSSQVTSPAYFAWDMSEVSYRPAPPNWVKNQRDAPFIEVSPTVLSGPANSFYENFMVGVTDSAGKPTRVFATRGQPPPAWVYPVRGSGQKWAGIWPAPASFTADSPALKVFDWAKKANPFDQ